MTDIIDILGDYMHSLNNFGDRLKEMIIDNKIIRIEDFCKEIGVGRTDFYRWWSNKTVPSVENIVKLANAFNCTVDFLIGKVDDNYITHFKALPPFSQQLRSIMNEYGTNPYKLSRDAKISRASVYEWLNGTSEITLASLIKVAETLDCSVDYLIGRE
jgi:transcriptional regulator with XRE-family HTH domain